MDVTDRCIVSVGVNGNYGKVGIPRLRQSLIDVGEKSDTMLYQDEYPPGSLPDHVAPRSFKLSALLLGANAGFTTLLWCDATVCWEKPLTPVWDRIARDGYYFHNWTNLITDIGNPEAFTRLGEDFDLWRTWKVHTVLGGLWGFDLKTDIGRAVWDFMVRAMTLGAFMGPDGRDEVPMSIMVRRWCLKATDPKTEGWFLPRQTETPERLAWFEGV